MLPSATRKSLRGWGQDSRFAYAAISSLVFPAASASRTLPDDDVCRWVVVVGIGTEAAEVLEARVGRAGEAIHDLCVAARTGNEDVSRGHAPLMTVRSSSVSRFEGAA
jgi:hypothetical protein